MSTKLKKLLLFTVLVLGSLLLFRSDAFASDKKSCSCIADPLSKQYQAFSQHFWGNHRAWSCNYTCYIKGESEPLEIVGYHSANYFRKKDNGSEGVCDGIPLDYVYNNYVGWYIYMPREPRHFDPVQSKSKNLKAWAKETCR